MSTLTVSRPAVMKACIETQVHSGLYSSASNYVQTLIHEGHQRRAEAMFAALFLAACLAVRMQRL